MNAFYRPVLALALVVVAFAGLSALQAAPVAYSGKLAVHGENFDGPGHFRFQLVDHNGSARWSNDRFLSTPHRVYNRQNRDRYSMAFFYDPNMDSRIVCLPSCADEANPPRYESVVYGDYLMERLNANHAYRHKG